MLTFINIYYKQNNELDWQTGSNWLTKLLYYWDIYDESNFTDNKSISQRSPNVTKYHKMLLYMISATKLGFALIDNFILGPNITSWW